VGAGICEGHMIDIIRNLKVKIFVDAASLDDLRKWADHPLVQGFTTNPLLMCRAGVGDYADFSQEVLAIVKGMPVSFEVLADEFEEMEAQAHIISSWGQSVYVKIPITNTRGESSGPLIKKLANAGVRVNVTAVMTSGQVRIAADALEMGPPSIISVFAGRIADTWVDPCWFMSRCGDILHKCPRAELLWASTREVLNIWQANTFGCHIITVPPGILAKMDMVGKDPKEFSLETVRLFYESGRAAGLRL